MFQKIFTLLAIATLVSCVPAKRYEEAQKASKQYKHKSEECAVEVGLLKGRITQLESEIAALAKEKSALEQDTALLGMKNRTLQNHLAILENDLKALAAKLGDDPEYRALLKHLLQMQDELANSEGKRIDAENAFARQKDQLAEAAEALMDSEERLAQSNQARESLDAELASARQSIEEQAARLRELEAALSAKDSAMAKLRNTIANALVDFSSDDLTVHHKNGKVYVSLEEQLLFESGKYDVNEKGQTALRKIAAVLAQQTDLDIIIEGHTDNVPFRGPVIVDNWDLSVKRATSVLRILLSSASIDVSRVQATGRADTQPLDNADTPEARRKNRRTEIILAPDMDKVLGILDNE